MTRREFVGAAALAAEVAAVEAEIREFLEEG